MFTNHNDVQKYIPSMKNVWDVSLNKRQKSRKNRMTSYIGGAPVTHNCNPSYLGCRDQQPGQTVH
jgi:hypothetical protein